MPKISERGLKVQESAIRKLVPLAEAAKEKGIKVYHLNIGQPDIKAPFAALESLQKINPQAIIEYSNSAGNISYRKKLAQSYQKIGIDVTADEIIITTGGSEALIFAFMTTLDEGDEIIVPEPFYTNYNSFAFQVGVKIIPISSSISNDFALPPIEDFEKVITERTKGIIICNPNNPTGYLYSKEELLKLKTIVKKYDLYIYSDEVYREFCYDGNEHFSTMKLGLDNNVILIDSVSKRYSMCGARIGCMVTKNKSVIKNALKFAQARLCPPYFGQIAAESTLDISEEEKTKYFKDVYDEYIARRNCMVEGLNNISGVYCPKPKGAFYTVVKLPIDDADKFASWLLTDFSYNYQTVMLAPATGFYSDAGKAKGLGRNEVRVAYVLNVEDLKKAIECLSVAIKEYQAKFM